MVNLKCCAVEKGSRKMIQILRFYLFLGVLYDIGHSSYVPKAGSLEIFAFSSEVQYPPSGNWKSITGIPRGSSARLICITSATSPSTFRLRNLNEEHSLPTQYAQQQLIHNFGKIDCHQMGTYVCENVHDGISTNSTIDIGIFGCKPSLCDNEDKTRTIFTSVIETKAVSLCVVAYPDISQVELKTKSIEAESQPVLKDWQTHMERRGFNTFTVTLIVKIVSKDDFGRHTFSIFTLYEGQRKELEYTLDLKLQGPPDCPSNIQITSNTDGSVKLSWQPGSDGGLEQSFQVFYSLDNKTWQVYGNVTQDKSMTISKVQGNINYAFRIISLNKFTYYISPLVCSGTAYKRAASSATVSKSRSGFSHPRNTPDKGTEKTAIAFVTCVCLYLLIGLGTVVGYLLLIKIWTECTHGTI